MSILNAQLMEMLTQGAAKIFAPCGLPGCHAHSLGLVCKACSRFSCQRHSYASASPPRIICVSCIMEEHRELWAEDENIIEAEIVE